MLTNHTFKIIIIIIKGTTTTKGWQNLIRFRYKAKKAWWLEGYALHLRSLSLSLSLSLTHTHTHKCKHIDTVRNAWDLTEKVLALYIFWCAGNETFERMASVGLLANFMVYLTRELHMDQVSAANILNLWFGVSNFAPLLGAFISDSYVGRFSTIAFGSFALFLVCPPSFLNYLL